MSDSVNFAEYHYEKKKEGGYRLRLLIGRLICILIGILPFILPLVSTSLMWMIVPAMLIFCFMIYVNIFVGRLLSIEYEYTVDSGVFKMDKVNGRGKHKELLSVRVRDMKVIAPYTAEKKDEISACVLHDCCISIAHPTPDIYYAIYTDAKDGKDHAVIFEATAKVLSVMKFYNSDKLTVKKDLRY